MNRPGRRRNFSDLPLPSNDPFPDPNDPDILITPSNIDDLLIFRQIESFSLLRLLNIRAYETRRKLKPSLPLQNQTFTSDRWKIWLVESLTRNQLQPPSKRIRFDVDVEHSFDHDPPRFTFTSISSAFSALRTFRTKLKILIQQPDLLNETDLFLREDIKTMIREQRFDLNDDQVLWQTLREHRLRSPVPLQSNIMNESIEVARDPDASMQYHSLDDIHNNSLFDSLSPISIPSSPSPDPVQSSSPPRGISPPPIEPEQVIEETKPNNDSIRHGMDSISKLVAHAVDSIRELAEKRYNIQSVS